MESYPLMPHSMNVHVAHFTIRNAQELRTRLVTASTMPDGIEGNLERERVRFTFIDAAMISSRLHLLTAVNQALLAESSDTLATHNIHSEVVWMLEPGTNISDSLKNFGLSKATTNLIIVRIAPMIDSLAKSMEEEESIFEAMQSLVDGETADIELLGGLPNGGTNWKALRKIYKLNVDTPALASVVAGSIQERAILDELCIGAVAVKSIAH